MTPNYAPGAGRGRTPARRRRCADAVGRRVPWLTAAVTLLVPPGSVAAQVDTVRARHYFEQAALCERDGGRLWGVSLCGPMAIADAATRTIATNRPAPAAPAPAVLGYANAALAWGDERWSTFVWSMVDASEARTRIFLPELFHRIQSGLGLLLPEPDNGHLETADGRYWMQLEWRSLANAIASSGAAREAAIAEALAFRAARHARFPGAAENERVLLVNEGLAQYTGTVLAASSAEEAANDVRPQLEEAPVAESFVRTFAYPSGAAWGILLDAAAPGWPRRFRASDDAALLLAAATAIAPAPGVEGAARARGGDALRESERRREAEHTARVAALRRVFVEGPVLILPKGRTASFVSTGVTVIPGQGTVMPTYRTTTEWGTLEADAVLLSTDQSRIIVPAPAPLEGTTLRGEGWTLRLAPGWAIRPADRPGDYHLVRAG